MVMDSSQEISGPKRSLFTPKIALKKREMSDDSAEIWNGDISIDEATVLIKGHMKLLRWRLG